MNNSKSFRIINSQSDYERPTAGEKAITFKVQFVNILAEKSRNSNIYPRTTESI